MPKRKRKRAAFVDFHQVSHSALSSLSAFSLKRGNIGFLFIGREVRCPQSTSRQC